MYDTMLFGNGLTSLILNNMEEHKIIVDKSLHKKLKLNNFIQYFVDCDVEDRVYREYNKLFDIRDGRKRIRGNREARITREQCRKIIRDNVVGIKEIGFENWFSKYYENSSKNGELIIYLYCLYNYWFSYIYKHILRELGCTNYLKNIADIISNNVSGRIYTTNFDLMFDNYLDIEHIHGKFNIMAKKYDDIKAYEYNHRDGEAICHEYKYLYSANCFEKLWKLERIKGRSEINEYKHTVKSYDLDFFYSNEVEFGHLLIYGVSFSKSNQKIYKLKTQYDEYKDSSFSLSIDGHILMRLEKLYEQNKLSQITLAYYNDNDRNNYEEILDKSNLKKCVKLIKCKDALNIY